MVFPRRSLVCRFLKILFFISYTRVSFPRHCFCVQSVEYRARNTNTAPDSRTPNRVENEVYCQPRKVSSDQMASTEMGYNASTEMPRLVVNVFFDHEMMPTTRITTLIHSVSEA